MSAQDPLTIHLLLHDHAAELAFEAASRKYALSLSSSSSLSTLPAQDRPFTVEIHPCSLSELSQDVKLDLIVSPANSYGVLDGGFDGAISRALAPRNDFHALTRVAQEKLRVECRGFLRPGMCLLVDVPEQWRTDGGGGREGAEGGEISGEGEKGQEEKERGLLSSKNVWGVKYLALCPTMRMPYDVRWDREVVYECVWSLLSEIEKHNRGLPDETGSASASGSQSGDKGLERKTKIRNILMAPLATGAGQVSSQRWAEQLCLAMRHWQLEESRREGEKVGWETIIERCQAVERTWNL